MRRLTSLGAALVMSLALCSAPASVVLAQDPSAEAPADEGLSTKWATAYGLVGLGVVLGLINVCRPGKRKGDPVKPA